MELLLLSLIVLSYFCLSFNTSILSASDSSSIEYKANLFVVIVYFRFNIE